ncbi:hypothetical protein CU098_010732 [Rhizopus stolonifer]|uniref:Uncharacterized protein n=1 Tax=Rhizopus stolonifer TaxID=4846 RepID=A0A367KYJ9_RHIST|nr:hypothetical protein CU098_010732 [Rhizopus stolonifer]
MSNPESESTTDIKKLIEARTAILLGKNHSNSSEGMWLLEHMFRPLTTGEYDGFQLLYLSGGIRPAWVRKRKDSRQQLDTPQQQVKSPVITDEAGTPASAIISTQLAPSAQPNDKMYVITPRTRILKVAKEHCMVFIIDLSSSLATIETNTGNVMIGDTFSVIENMINGLIKPFELNVSDASPPIIMENIVRITVIAECSQFGSNMNVIPILAEYPTMRVLMQNVQVSVNNSNAVLKNLKEGIDAFKSDLSKFRKKLIMRRLKVGYELDVRDNHAQSVTDSADSNFSSLESPTTPSTTKKSIQSRKTSVANVMSSKSSIYPRTKTIPSKQQSRKDTINNTKTKTNVTGIHNRNHHHHHRHSSSTTSNGSILSGNSNRHQTKDTWGVGKTGSTLAYILRAGLFALQLLPKDGQPSIVLLTDGVVKSNIQDESVIRELVAENIACNVIQIGKDKCFFPGLNFGFVPDNEILEFVTSTTNGVFTFAEYCPPIVDEQLGVFSAPPNIYHHRYMLKEIYFDSSKALRTGKNKDNVNVPSNTPENDSATTMDRSSSVAAGISGPTSINPMMMESHWGRRAFPWDPMSKPIMEDSGRLKFKEYFLPSECWHFMRARLRQGFVLHSVSFTDEVKPVSSKSSNGLTKQLSTEGLTNFQKKQNVLIVFVLRWQPNVTVQYSIKSLWTSSLRSYLKSISTSQDRLLHIPEEPHILKDDSMFNCMRAPKVEIVVKSTSTFSHMLHNWDSFQRRSQMMAVQGGNTTVDLARAPGLIKVGKMKRLLERLAETDSMLKQLVQFNFSDRSNILATSHQFESANSAEWAAQLSYIQKFSTHWAKLERSELRIFNMCWYDESSFNLILQGSSVACNMASYYMNSTEMQQQQFSNEFDEAQATINQVYAKLEKWSTFMSEDQQVYIKILNLHEELKAVEGSKRSIASLSPSNSSSKRHIVPQFCEVRVVRETQRVLYIRIMFFNANASLRQAITGELQYLLDTKDQHQMVSMLPETNDSPLNIPNSSGNDAQQQQFDSTVGFRLSKRPLSTLLMRDSSHFLAYNDSNKFESEKNSTPSNKSLWYVYPTLSLTGEFIVRNYLNRSTWYWDVQDIHQDKHPYGHFFTPVINMAFDHIMFTRLSKEWNLISCNKLFAHFYKEVTYGNDMSSIYAMQYFIWKDVSKKRISTEIWAEPVISDEATLRACNHAKIEIFEEDKQIISQFITFDAVYSFGSNYSSSVTEALMNQMEVEDEIRGSVKWMQRNAVFNLSSILRLGTFLFALYPCPNYSRHYHPESSSSSFQNDLSLAVGQQQESLQQEHETNVNDIRPDTTATVSYLRGRRNNGTPSSSSTVTGTRSRTVSKFSPIGSPLPTSVKTPLSWQNEKGTSSCTCPRPDKLFSAEKDSISKLRPVLRDIALLHYYVEQSLFAVTDRSISLNKTPVDNFWYTHIKELLKYPELCVSKSTLYTAQNFRDLRCFIKIFDPSAFIVILIPRLDAIVKGLVKLDRGSYDPPLFNTMGLTMFECKRQADSSQKDAVKVTLMDPYSYREWLESLKSTLRPTLAYGYSSIEPSLSDRTLRLMQDVTQVYSRSFVKSIFTCLLHGRAVDSEDFEKVLEICDETNIDIDLTGYLNIQALLKRRSRTNEEELISANQRFVSVLGHYFEPVIISNSERSNVYCYRPPFAKAGQKLGLSLSLGEKPSSLADVVMCAQNPLFIRLDCTLRKPHRSGIGYEEVIFPLKSLPVSYEGETEDGVQYRFEPESIGTHLSPVDSADGTTATLHLVCMSLPQSDYDPLDTSFSHQPTCPSDNTMHHQSSFLDVDKTYRDRLLSLSQDKQDALVETEARLTWLFTEEIMHGLLRSGPITQSVIRYIEAQLKKKNPFVDFPTTMLIPLTFVKNQKESRRLFFEELEKHDSTSYRLIRVGDCFYASDNGVSNTILSHQGDDNKLEDNDTNYGISLFDGEGLNITTEPSIDRTHISDEEQDSDEFCQGLGISILEPEISEEEEIDKNQEDEGTAKTQLYWLLLIPQAQNVQVYFYSKMQQFVNRSEIIRVTKSMVNEVMEKTNKLSLLQSLNNTRLCSKYLLTSVDEDKSFYSSCDESSEEEDCLYDSGSNSKNNNNLVDILSTSGEETAFSPIKKFVPGQFSCDIVYTKRFPLHWRIAPNTAYNKLMTDTLPPFLVRNKAGMFVCSHENSVLYFFLSEENAVQQSSATLSDSMNQSFLSTNNNNNNQDDGYYAANPESPYGSSLLINNPNDSEVLGTSHCTRVRHSSYVYNKPSPQESMSSQQFSPHHSPSLTDAGVPAISPVGGKKANLRSFEGRELVLEVHGVELDYYIIDGLVDMIDARITSEITLKEVQQFLVRNPNSRLSRADIDFILPVEKEPLVHCKLKLPSLISNTVHFVKILRKNILSESSLHVIHSNYLSAFIRRHHDLRYNNYNEQSHIKILDENEHQLPSEDWSCLDLCFYYNYLNRAPGTYLPFEQRVGEGVAGICLSILNEDDSAYSKIISSYPGMAPNEYYNQLNLDSLKSCLTSDFEDLSDGKLILGVDIWSHCKIGVEHIYHHVHKAFKQSICDYVVENLVHCCVTSSRQQQETDEFKLVANSLLYTLDTATEWQSSTVKKMSHTIQLAPWYFDNIIMQLKLDLTEIHPSLEPIVARAELATCVFDDDEEKERYEEYKLYLPDHGEGVDYFSTRQMHKSEESLFSRFNLQLSKVNNYSNGRAASSYSPPNKQNKKKLIEAPTFNNKDYRYFIVSGLPELYSKYISSSSLSIRRSSTEVTDATNFNLRAAGRNVMYFGSSGSINPIGEDELPTSYHKNESFRRDDSISLHSRQESLASSISKAFPNHISKQRSSNTDYKDISHQHSFMIFTMDSSQFTVYAYNCSEQFSTHVYNATYKNVMQQETRQMGLNNILHQKIGLFHHSDTMSTILSRQYQEPDNSLNAPSQLQHSALSQIHNSSMRSTMSPSLANTISRLVQTDSSSSIPTIESVDRRSSSSKQTTIVVDFENLQQLIRNTYEHKNRTTGYRISRISSSALSGLEMSHPQSTLDAFDNARLCNMTRSTSDPVYTAFRGANANTVLRDVYVESTQDNKYWYDSDYLVRHGEPYLEVYLARAKPLAAHEKAFKVYTKWADQYYGPGHTSTVDEMMTVDELKQILKASRLLHFCRTPLIFSESTVISESATTCFEKLFNNVSKTREMTTWYEQLSQDFMREYASYLESIGMHLIVYGPSNDQPDEMEAYQSRFTITKDYSVDSPVVYLLQVFEGGSIMCEVRLTDAFVSVTLYTLHRRYGRLQHSPYSYQRKEIGRESFQTFMSECDQFKQRIHVNSFVYDFHLRYIQRSLDNVALLPPSLNMLSIIKNTASVYDRPAIYSRNRILSGIYEFPLTEEPVQGLISWILSSGKALGLKTLKVDQNPVACFVSSDDLSFDSQNSESSNEAAPFRHTLMICPAENLLGREKWHDNLGIHRQGSFDIVNSNPVQKFVGRIMAADLKEDEYSRKISLQYFILVTYRGMDRCTSKDRCQRAWSKVVSERPKRYSNPLNEVLVPETYTLNDVFQSAKLKMHQIMKKALYFYQREADWNKLYKIIHPNISQESPEDLVQLAKKFNPIQLEQIDPSFSKFLQLKGINWNNALDNLKLFYIMASGEIHIKDTRHVLLFVPNTATPAFFHFAYTSGGKCTVTINSKKHRDNTDVLTNDEKDYIITLATSLSYYLWKRIV